MAKTPSKSKASDSAETKLVRDLANILNDTNLTEIEVEKGTLRVRVARETFTMAAPVAAAPIVAEPAPVAAASAAAAPVAPAPADDYKNAMKSPMVGTAYVRPSPEADPFVKVGDMVKAGATVILIEAMKTFNPITADKTGRLTAVMVEDAQPVEFGEPLFVIE